jgi:prephenate dehydrogenase
MFNRVAIIGLGLIGGSMGLALHRSRIAKQIVGHDLGRGVSVRARQSGAIDEAYDSLADAVRGAELVILATPVGPMRALLQSLATVLTPGTIVTDVASTKTQVISWAEEFLPTNVAFVGGHPMAGKEVSGVESADADLFQNCIYCLTPTARTRPEAINKVVSLVEAIGARLRFLEPGEHDGQVAGVSHLPFLASLALMDVNASDPVWSDARLLASSGFRDATRLAGGNPEMYRDICMTNSSAIVRWLDAYVNNLNALRERIAGHDKHLNEDFARIQQQRQQWQLEHNSGE